MNIYISWSGELSHAVALLLKKHFNWIAPEINVWVSESDLRPGERWRERLFFEMQRSELSILCVTRGNLTSPWLLFEAGFIAGKAEKHRIIQLLVDLSPSDLFGPLAQYQALRCDQESLKRLLIEICNLSSVKKLPIEVVNKWSKELALQVSNVTGKPAAGTEQKNVEYFVSSIETAAKTHDLEQLQRITKSLDNEALSNSQILLTLFDAQLSIRDYSAVIDTYTQLKSKFKVSEETTRRYAIALLRTAAPAEAVKVLRGLKASPEKFGLLGKAYRDLWQKCLAEGNELDARKNLKHAAETYVRGFDQFSDYYLGSNAAELLHIMGDVNSIQEKNRILPLVEQAVKKTIEETGGDYWAMSTLLELAVLKGDQAGATELTDKIISFSHSSWELQTTASALRFLLGSFNDKDKIWVIKLATNLDSAASEKKNG